MKLASKISKQHVIKIIICLFFAFLLTPRGLAGGPPATIIVQPLGLSVQNGGTAILTTTAISVGSSMTFQWLFNGQPVSTTNTTVGNVVVPLVGTVSTLTVNHVDSASAGNYSVRITNGSGSVTSSTVNLIVLTDTLTDTLSNVVSFVSTETGMVTGGFKLKMSGPTGSNVVIEATSDMKNWTPICTNLISNGSITYTDAVAKTLPSRYYRAKIQ